MGLRPYRPAHLWCAPAADGDRADLGTADAGRRRQLGGFDVPLGEERGSLPRPRSRGRGGAARGRRRCAAVRLFAAEQAEDGAAGGARRSRSPRSRSASAPGRSKGSNSMARTAQLDLPLVMPAQAQKHVTVNEALARLDAVAQLRVVSSMLPGRLLGASDGASYLVPEAPAAHGSGMAGRIAVRSNGGWIYLSRGPAGGPGTRAGGASDVRRHGMGGGRDDGLAARRGRTAGGHRSSTTSSRPAAANSTAVAIPNQAQVLGVTGRVVARWRSGSDRLADRCRRLGQPLRLGARAWPRTRTGRPERCRRSPTTRRRRCS